MIRDVDATLSSWLAPHLPGVRITFDPPDRSAEQAEGVEPALTLYLHGLREDPDGSMAGWDTIRNADGVVVARTPPSRRYRLSYLLIPNADDTLVEHDILGRVLVVAAESDVVPTDCLTGSLADAERDVLVRCAPASGVLDPQHLWAAWGCRPRTTLELSVLAPLPLSFVQHAPPPPSRIELGASRRGPDTTANGQPARRQRRPITRVDER